MSYPTELLGMRFGRLVVLDGVPVESGRAKCLCRCDCGNTKVVRENSLKTGNTTSCGCISREKASKRLAKDLTGMRFGHLVAQQRQGSDKYCNILWLCHCDCGEETVVRANALLSGNTTSCGCARGQPGGELDLVGKTFGRLTVTRFGYSTDWQAYWKSYWYCDCSCGNKDVLVSGPSLRAGNTRSCGCLKAESSRNRQQTHGMSGTRLHRIWKGMRYRCDNPNADPEERYYFLGITYDSVWEKFEPFCEWAMANGYRDDLTLDRINPFRNYCPNNCRWIPLDRQAANTSITYMRLLREAFSSLPDGGQIVRHILVFMQSAYDDKFWCGVFREVNFDLLDDESALELEYFLKEYTTAMYYIYVYQYCELTKCALCIDSGTCRLKQDASEYLDKHQSVFDAEGWPLPVILSEAFHTRTIKE